MRQDKPYAPKTNGCILFLRYVQKHYRWSDGGQEWTDKAGRRRVTELEMYRAFNRDTERKTS